MAYSTDADIFDRLSEQEVQRLTDDDSSGAVDTTVLANVRENVADEMDIYLRRQYDLPIQDSAAQKVLAGLEVDILAHRLYARRPNVEIPDSITELKDEAFDTLDRIAKHGGLGIDQDGDGTDDGGSNITVQTPNRTTLQDKMTGRY